MSEDALVTIAIRITRASCDEMLIESWLRLKDSKATRDTYFRTISQFTA